MKFFNAPIHDLLIRIKNAYLARRTEVQWVIHSKFKVNVLNILKEYNFIKGFEEVTHDNKKYLTIHLNEVRDPVNDIPVVKFYSKPSIRYYTGYKKLKTVAWGRGIGLISTSRGLMPAHVAKKLKIGGELIADIY